MSITVRKVLACYKGLVLLSLLVIFIFPQSGVEAQAPNAKKYGPSYFFAIQGEVYGQTAPGIEAVLVNGKPVPIDKDLTFRTKVSLAKGQKYLTIETRYKNLRFIKKYLVIRHPKAQKTFKVQ